MIPKEALAILDASSAAAAMTRLDHVRAQQAIVVLTSLIDSKNGTDLNGTDIPARTSGVSLPNQTEETSKESS